MHLASFTTLCCDRHYAVGSTGTIYSAGCGIFKDLYIFNIVGVEIVDVVNNKSVNNIKGVRIVHSASTSNLDGGRATWSTRILNNVHTRSTSLQRLHGR